MLSILKVTSTRKSRRRIEKRWIFIMGKLKKLMD